jgi:cardiolipin synthase (CMP-forming)
MHQFSTRHLLSIRPLRRTSVFCTRDSLVLALAHKRLVPAFSPRFFGISSSRRGENARHSPPPKPAGDLPTRENIYTVPNLLTASRILACPVLGWSILNSDFYLATSLLLYAGITDLVRFLLDAFLSISFWYLRPMATWPVDVICGPSLEPS